MCNKLFPVRIMSRISLVPTNALWLHRTIGTLCNVTFWFNVVGYKVIAGICTTLASVGVGPRKV